MPSSLRRVTLLSRAPACLAGAFLAAAELGSQGQTSLPRLLAAELGPPPSNVRSEAVAWKKVEDPA